MRVSNQMLTRMLSHNIQDNQSAVYNKEQQIASGKRIQKASDDPAAWGRISRLHAEQGELAQYSRNSQLLEGRLLSADQALDSIAELLQSASELAVQASDGTLNAEDRTVLAVQVDQLLEQLVMQSNSQFNGAYQFGGVQTAMEPFAITRNADGQIDSVSYVGGSVTGMVEIAEGAALPAQMVGSDPANGILISGSGDAFAPLVAMRDRLLAGENLAESDLLPQVGAALEQVLVGRASIGAHLEHLAFTGEVRGDREAFLMENLSAEEGIDIAQAVTELSEKQTAYQAALAMATKTINLSLLNYI